MKTVVNSLDTTKVNRMPYRWRKDQGWWSIFLQIAFEVLFLETFIDLIIIIEISQLKLIGKPIKTKPDLILAFIITNESFPHYYASKINKRKQKFKQ